jgi:Ser/Thr protein kinase RdoA (MazF antagonist)
VNDERETEIALPAGRLTAGVVRVGDTVRRPRKPSSEFVASVLNLLASKGFDAAPRYLGSDAQGRDVLSFIAGSVPPKWRRFDDAQVVAAARILRAFHDVTRATPLVAAGQVICHHDPGPNNFVFQHERPVALIDFDMAAPGDPLEDVGYLAWAWCVSSKPTREDVRLQAAQVRVLANAYGLAEAERSRLVAAMIARQHRNALFWSDQLTDGFSGPPTSEERLRELVAWSEREMRFTLANEHIFSAALRGN